MQDILDCLYEYVYEHRLPRLLNADPAYLDAGRMEDRAEEWLEANLDPEAQKQLVLLRENRLEQEELLQRALCRCGLALGLELGALSRFPG